MGGDWHMPTTTQCIELINNTTYSWTTINNVAGGKFIAPNGNYIFFPSAGVKNASGNRREKGESCYIWTSTQASPIGNSHQAYYMYLTSNFKKANQYFQVFYGCSVRGVVG